MKKIIFLVIILFSLTGCTSYTELNDLSIVNTLGIDYQDNKYYLTLSVIEDDLENDKSIAYFSSSEEDLNEAIKDIYLITNKKLYLSHIDLLILTPNSINNKLNEILDNFLKNNEYRNNFQVVLMNDNDLYTFFEKGLDSQAINSLIDINSIETSITSKKELEIFLKEILIDNNSYLPTISFLDDKLELNGYTLIKDKTVYKELSKDDSIVLNILSKKANKAYIEDITIYENDIRITSNKNKIKFEIYITSDTDDEQKVENLKKAFYNFIEEYQKIKYDILKLKELIRKNDYSYYKRHKDLLTNLKFDVKIINKKQNNFINGGLNEK